MDRIKIKLASWQGSLLSIVGGIQLVKSVIQGMLIYSFQVYKRLASLLKTLDQWLRNFIWSGVIDVHKLVIVAWHTCCKPTLEGGLGLRPLSIINRAALLKLNWELVSSDKQWACFLRSRFIGKKGQIRYTASSLWPSFRGFYNTIHMNSGWVLGNGSDINFWSDYWAGQPLVEVLHIPPHLQSRLRAIVQDFIVNNSWNVPAEIVVIFPQLQKILDDIVLPNSDRKDELIWRHAASGDLTFKEAYHFYCPSQAAMDWCKHIWIASIPPLRAFLFWRWVHGKLPTDDKLQTRGCTLVSQCSLCQGATESAEHLLLSCPYVSDLWLWVSSITGHSVDDSGPIAWLKQTDSGHSPHAKEVLTSIIIHVVWVVWFSRNQARFHNRSVSICTAISMVKAAVHLTGFVSNGKTSTSMQDFTLLKLFSIAGRPQPAPQITPVTWHAPLCGWFKCNSDGAALGSPGPSGCGGIFRDSTGGFVGGFASPLGIGSAFQAEAWGIILAIEFAYARGWSSLWVECDSALAVSAFNNPTLIPWSLRSRWLNCIHISRSMRFLISHIFREGNACADKLAAHAIHVATTVWWDQLPSFLSNVFFRNRAGLPEYRFRL